MGCCLSDPCTVSLSPGPRGGLYSEQPVGPPLIEANPGDGICDILPPLNVCTLRAAIQEANALPGADQIILPSLPPNVLEIVTELVIVDHLTITGGGAATTIIDGNKSMRPNSGVLTINSGVTVSVSGVTIRNGGRTVGMAVVS